jgi:hypothetical protein
LFSDLQIPFSSSRITPSDPRRTRPQLSLSRTYRPRPKLRLFSRPPLGRNPPSELQLSAFTQSGVIFQFSAFRPSAPPSAFPARAPLFSVATEHDCHLARMLQRQAPRVLACLATHDRARPNIPSVLSLARAFLYHGQATSYLLVPFVAPRTQALRSCFQAPQLSSPAAFLSPHKSGRCIRAPLTLAGLLQPDRRPPFLFHRPPLFFTGESSVLGPALSPLLVSNCFS